MSFEIIEISKTEKQAKFNINEKEVSDGFMEVAKLYQKDADEKGFRKGKVPLNIIESKYSKQILEELKSRLINLYVNKLSVENNLNVVRTSKLKDEGISKSADFKFEINVEIIPEFKLKDYKEISIEKEVFKLTKKQISEAKSNVMNNFATNEEILKRKKIKKGDFADINFSGFIEGQEIEKLKRQNAIVEIGNGSLIPEIENEIINTEKNKEVEFFVTYPKDFPIEEAASKKVKCLLKINKILKKVIPKIDQNFLEKIGFKNEDDFDKRISEDLNASLEQKSQSSLRKNLFDKLIDQNEFDFPKSFVDDEKIRLMQDYKNKMAQQGIKIEDLDDKTLKVIDDSAFRNVKIALIFAQISKLENIFAEDKEVGEYLAAFASSQKVPVDKVLKYYKDNNLLNDVKVKLTDEKVIQFLMSKAKINEVKPKEEKKKQKKDKS